MEAMRGLIGSACHGADLALAASPGMLRRVVQAAGTFAILGRWQGDVMLTRDEIRGLMEGRLAVDGATPIGRRLSEWLRVHADELGRMDASELARCR